MAVICNVINIFYGDQLDTTFNRKCKGNLLLCAKYRVNGMNCVRLTPPPPPNPKEFVPLYLFKASSINSTFSIQLFHSDSRVYFVSYLCHGMVRAVIKLVLSKLYNYFEFITFCYSYLGRQLINLTKLFVLGVCFRSSIEISRAQCKLHSKPPLCVQEHQHIFVVFVL